MVMNKIYGGLSLEYLGLTKDRIGEQFSFLQTYLTSQYVLSLLQSIMQTFGGEYSGIWEKDCNFKHKKLLNRMIPLDISI